MTAPSRPDLRRGCHGQVVSVDDETAARWRAEGWWEDRTIRSLLSEAARRHPERVALVGRRSDGTRPTRSYAEFDANAHAAANALASLGVGPGDTVVVMLPNWVEYAELVFGINEIGAVYAGIPVAYGVRQAEAIVRRSKARVLVVPRRWRSNETLELARRLRREVPTLEYVVVLDEEPAELHPGEVLWSSLAGAGEHEVPAPAPESLCYLGFTSGTTGEPKGAMHTHESLIYSARQQAEHLGPGTYGDPMVQLVASPAGHHTGFVWGIVFTALLAGTAVHVDRWDPAWGADVIREEGITAFFGAPTFLQDIVRVERERSGPNPLRCLVIAGAPIPRGLPSEASATLGALVSPAWGMTECSIITACPPTASEEMLRTDGSVFAGSEIRVVGADGAELPAGEVGDLLIRGPAVTLGYFDRPDATERAFSDGLWFDTGDRASIDVNGWLSLRGRAKDIVIRGGENIPVTDIESLLFEHPDIVDVAVVGVPDDRLGERVGVALVVRDGATAPTLGSVTEYLLGRGLSRHYLPEHVVVVPALPTTPSGKVQKFRVKEMLL